MEKYFRTKNFPLRVRHAHTIKNIFDYRRYNMLTNIVDILEIVPDKNGIFAMKLKF